MSVLTTTLSIPITHNTTQHKNNTNNQKTANVHTNIYDINANVNFFPYYYMHGICIYMVYASIVCCLHFIVAYSCKLINS